MTLAASLRYLWFLSGISGTFWFLFRIVGYFASTVHDALFEEIAVLFAVVYNFILAAAFSAIIFISSVTMGKNGGHYFLFEACGFVFVYLMLSATYTDGPDGGLSDASFLGFWGGLLTYLGFAMFPEYLVVPSAIRAYRAVSVVAQGWVGQCVSAYAAFKFMSYAIRRAADALTSHPRIRVRRR